MAARADDLLHVEYFHIVFIMPAGIARIAYTQSVAISNSRPISADANTVAFKWENYRIKELPHQR